MNRNVLLIATREFRQIARTRSFWLTLLVLPLMLAVMPFITRLIDPPAEQTMILIDRSHSGAGKAIADQVALGRQRDILAALATFADRHDLARLAPDAAWGHKAGWYPDALVARFVNEGGSRAALRTIRAHDPALADKFSMPRNGVALLPVPDALTRLPFDRLDASVAPYVSPPEGAHRKPVDYILAIPDDFGARPGVKLWTSGRPSPAVMALLQAELTRALRGGYLTAQGVAPPIADLANRIEPAIALTQPKEVGGREKLVIQSLLPVAMSYILLMSLIMSGQWMLQSTIEERSGKLIEAVLACVSPRDFMHGKLLGTIAVGMVMVLTWFACGLFAGYATQGVIADFIRPALAPLNSIGSVATILFFFLAGYLMVSLIFLTIGSMSDSMQEAQGFLVPTMLVLMMPVMVLIQLVVSGTDSAVVKAMTWIPLFAPFAVLARLGSGIETFEIVGPAALLLAFIGLEFMLLGRVFRASLLSGNGRPTFKTMARLMRQG